MIQVSNKKQSGENSVRFAFILMGLAFAALMGATWYTVKIALAGHEPIMDKNYYEKGLNYEKEIAVSKQMSQEGYRFDSTFMSNDTSTLQKGMNDIQIAIFKNDSPINNAKLYITRERTATSKFTEKKELSFENNGSYKTNIAFPFDGLWQITVTAKVEERNFEKTYMVMVK